MTPVDWELFAWLKRGKRRQAVLQLLKDSTSPLTANDVKDKLKIALSQASFTLKELREKQLVGCMNPNDKIGKLYRLSTEGRQLWQQLK